MLTHRGRVRDLGRVKCTFHQPIDEISGSLGCFSYGVQLLGPIVEGAKFFQDNFNVWRTKISFLLETTYLISFLQTYLIPKFQLIQNTIEYKICFVGEKEVTPMISMHFLNDLFIY